MAQRVVFMNSRVIESLSAAQQAFVNAGPPADFTGAQRTNAETLATSVDLCGRADRRGIKWVRQYASPGNIIALSRRAVVQHLCARARVKTVSANQRITFKWWLVFEVDYNYAGVLFVAVEYMVQPDRFAWICGQ